MARFYSNENIPLQVVRALRASGHDVLTSLEAGNANASIPDHEVLAFATSQRRILLSHNRRHFVRLHELVSGDHCGMVVCTFDPDAVGLAQRIHDALPDNGEIVGRLLRVNRPS